MSIAFNAHLQRLSNYCNYKVNSVVFIIYMVNWIVTFQIKQGPDYIYIHIMGTHLPI